MTARKPLKHDRPFSRVPSKTPIGESNMRILSIRPSPPGSATLARFDLELNDHLKLFNLALRQRPGARSWTVAPNAFGERTAALGEQFNRAISDMAFAALMELHADASTNA
ncbi:hypothetical protein [Bradyrhizobium glycinis]|uniref:hypothetical protein n=1 Tax=Bradyrhizobium glycinis TaxID=2751812 RepID=UPI0018D91037|nr:hypothetical protein [Bradyrhizobium glycinis]MBH5371482.1 hypothetical protein [Bradyrhizobium glycinis]